MRQKTRNAAFTMIELLVVIALVSVLIGLLAPALSGVGAGSRSLRCQANLRQMTTAASNYAAMYDAYPAAIRYESVNGEFRKVAWDWVTTFSNKVISPGALWTFTDNPGETMQCPDFDGSSTFGGDPYTGYNYNTSYIGGESPFPQVGWDQMRKGVPPHACSRGVQCAMFGEGGWKNGANKFMRAPLNNEGASLGVIYGGGQAFRHRGCTNVGYVDGHVGSIHRSHPGPLATPALLKDVMAHPANGFISSDDSAYNPREETAGMAMIDRCVCFNVTFREVVETARRDGMDFEAVRERFGCGRGCALCVPYVQAALATGQVEFRPDIPSPLPPPSDL